MVRVTRQGVWTRAALAAVPVAALMALVSGCDVGDIRQLPPSPPPAPSPSAVAPRPVLGQPDEVRRVRVPVPRGYYRQAVAFSDAEHGYALYVRCGSEESCQAVLIATANGGRTWRALRHPDPDARDHQIHATPGALYLQVGSSDWYVSRNGGRTFAHHEAYAPPPELTEGRETRGADGRWWRVEVDDGAPFTRLSMDRGASWRRIPVPAPGGALAAAQVELSPDGREAWLIGFQPDGATFPRLWWLIDDDTVWRPVPATGHPERFGGGAVALGGGFLAVSGEPGAGLVGPPGDYRPAGWPVIGPSLWMLADGTLVSAPDGGDLLIGTGTGTRRVWTRTTMLTR